MIKTKEIGKACTFVELLDIKYGKIGPPERDEYEAKVNMSVISEILK